MKLTIYHDGQFWIGVFEETVASQLKACRYVFGREPLDEEVLDLVKRKMLRLVQSTTQLVEVKKTVKRRVNPKRLARLAAEELYKTGVSTKAQEALVLERERDKIEAKIFTRQQKEEQAERKRELKRKKAKEKHRGR